MPEYPNSMAGILAASLLLAAVPALTGRVKFAERVGNPFLDLLAGISVAYVFVDVLPHLAAKQDKIDLSALDAFVPGGFVIYLIALAGFCFYLTAELVLTESRGNPRQAYLEVLGEPWPAWILASSIWIYSVFVGYMFTEQTGGGYEPLFIIACAMAAHFIGLHHVFCSRNPTMYATKFRIAYCGGPLLGCVLGLVTEPPYTVLACGFAWMAGGLVSSAMSQELPRVKNRRQLFFFCLGAALFALLILLAELFAVTPVKGESARIPRAPLLGRHEPPNEALVTRLEKLQRRLG
jgi:hypothetical protein